MDSYIASNGSCFMVIWTIFINHFLEVGPTQNREIMALRMLTTVELFFLSYVRPGHIWLHTTLRVHDHTT
jgi:hypothetical protein